MSKLYRGLLELPAGWSKPELNIDFAIWHVCVPQSAHAGDAVLRVAYETVALPTLDTPVIIGRADYWTIEASTPLEVYVKFLADSDKEASEIGEQFNIINDPERDALAEANQIVASVRASKRINNG